MLRSSGSDGRRVIEGGLEFYGVGMRRRELLGLIRWYFRMGSQCDGGCMAHLLY